MVSWTDNYVMELRARIAELEARIAELEAENASIRSWSDAVEESEKRMAKEREPMNNRIIELESRIAELEARINTDTCLVCGHTSVTDIESPCPVCELAKANKRIAELEAENVAMREAFTKIAEDIPVDCPWYMESIAEVCATILAAENK